MGGLSARKDISMSELEIAKEKFYNFLVGVAGLRFKSRKDFDEVVDAIVVAAQHRVQSDTQKACEVCGSIQDVKYLCSACR